MDNIYTYSIEIQGQAEAQDLQALSALNLTVTPVDTNRTRLNVDTDQSGLVGLIRQLHGRGLVLLTVRRE